MAINVNIRVAMGFYLSLEAPSLMAVELGLPSRSSSAYPAVRKNALVCVNVLAEEHQELSRLVGGKAPVEERFVAAT